MLRSVPPSATGARGGKCLPTGPLSPKGGQWQVRAGCADGGVDRQTNSGPDSIPELLNQPPRNLCLQVIWWYLPRSHHEGPWAGLSFIIKLPMSKHGVTSPMGTRQGSIRQAASSGGSDYRWWVHISASSSDPLWASELSNKRKINECYDTKVFFT